MKRLTSTACFALLLAVTLHWVTATLAVAQKREPTQNNPGNFVDEIPEEILQTEEGRRMVERLRFLRRSQQSIGPKHPGFAGIESEIESIRARLGLIPTPGNQVQTEVDPQLNQIGDEQLRQLIRRMALRIEFLEKRVDSLERRFEIF